MQQDRLVLCSMLCSNKVLRLSSGIDNLGEVQWHLALLLLQGWIIIFLVLIKGVNSLGKVSTLQFLREGKKYHKCLKFKVKYDV